MSTFTWLPRNMGKKVYAVRRGTRCGIFNTWAECEQQVKGVSKSQYKSFTTRAEAEKWLENPENTGPTIKKSVYPKSRTLHTNSPTPIIERALDSASRITVFTDGSALKNSREGADSRAGCGVYFGKNDERNQSIRLPGSAQTNQRAEIYAAILAVKAVGSSEPLEIRTDSQYVIKAMTEWIHNWVDPKKPKGFDSVQNGDLFMQLNDLCNQCTVRPRFTYVPAHVGIEGNEAADQLAKEGADKPRVDSL